MSQPTDFAAPFELRLIDPTRNRFRFYELIESRTLFGEACLRIVWGRIGHRRFQERTEFFADREALVRRREALLGRRRRHGYVPTVAHERAPIEMVDEVSSAPDLHAVEREIVEAHGLSPDDAMARTLVTRWHAATRDLARYLEARGVHADLIDASTLAEMFVRAA